MRKLLIWGISAAVLAVTGLYAANWVIEDSGWVALRPTAPHPRNFAAAIDEHLQSILSMNADSRSRCTPVQESIESRAPFEDSGFDFTPAGFRVVVRPNTVSNPEGLGRRLELMAQHGLFEKRALSDGGVEFTMTWKGFDESDDNGCFRTVRGAPVVSIVGWATKAGSAVSTYQITAQVLPGEVAQWAASKEFADAFGNVAAKMVQARSVNFEVARTERGFIVISENGSPVNSTPRPDPTLLKINAQRFGPIDAERIKTLLEERLNGPPQTKLCLPIPQSDEADETDFYTSVMGSGPSVRRTSSFFRYYNLLDRDPTTSKQVLRGYEMMRKLELLGLAKSEQVPASEFRNAAAAGAVHFTLEGPLVEEMLNSPVRCIMVARVVVENVLSFDPVDTWRPPYRIMAKLRIVPDGALGEKAMQSYGNFRRMAAIGMGMRFQYDVTPQGLVVSLPPQRPYGYSVYVLTGTPIRAIAYEPDVSQVRLPVVVGEKQQIQITERVSAEVPVQVSLVQVLEMSRISADGLTMTYSGAGTNNIARSSVARNRGKWYLEATLKTRPGAKEPDTYTTVGIARMPTRDADFFLNLPRAEAFNMRAISQPIRDGETIGIAFDADTSSVYFYRGGRWTHGTPGVRGGGVPLARSTDYVAYASSSASSSTSMGYDSWTFNFGRSAFKYEIPVGYISWDARVAGPGVKFARTGSAATNAAVTPGKEGVMNRCRDKDGRTTYLQRPCATAGLEQLGVVQGADSQRRAEASGSKRGDSITFGSGSNTFNCEDPTYAAIKRVQVATVVTADGGTQTICRRQ